MNSIKNNNKHSQDQLIRIVPVVKKMIRYSLMKEEQIYNIDLFYRIREDRMKSTY